LYLNRIRIVKEGSLPAEEIEKVIGLHYYSISSKAEADPSTLHVPVEKFKGHFNINWKEALESGSVYSAKKACEDFQLTGKELATLWARSKQLGKLCKLGGGFYVASVEIPGKKPIYVINGFYMEMKQKFTQPGSSIYFYVVDWDTKDLSWKDFRAYVLGTTDPTDAAEASLRGTIFKDWEKLGLKNKPNTGDNGVHASASPFEGLAERFNWLKVGIDSDPFGARAVRAGISVETLEKWSKDPVVSFYFYSFEFLCLQLFLSACISTNFLTFDVLALLAYIFLIVC